MPRWFAVFTLVIFPLAAFCQAPEEASVDLGFIDIEQGIIICNTDGSDGDFESSVCGPDDGADDRESKYSCANDEGCDPDDPFRN